MTTSNKWHSFIRILLLAQIFTCILYACGKKLVGTTSKQLRSGFVHPPDSARPGVYWYFMDGNLSRDAMTADLVSMKNAGIGNVIFLEVNVGVPRGHVDFLSEEWQELFAHAIRESERLGIEVTLGVGPGWTGSGGPWVSPDQSMQHLVSSTLKVAADKRTEVYLPLPKPRSPFFGEGVFTEGLKTQWNDFYEDVAVLAFPSTEKETKLQDIDEKALYFRAPYSSMPGVKPYIPGFLEYAAAPKHAIIDKKDIVDLTDKLQPDGKLLWEVPPGDWTIMRFGRRNNGAVTRPAPFPGLGFESDKFDTVALNAHLEQYPGKLLKKIGPVNAKGKGGLKRLHMDSWEMGSQNWTGKFREEFTKRRGYDPLRFYPVYAGNIVESIEVSERFLWDLRQTSQELVLENHAGHIKKYSHKNGLKLSIEPYDMNPTADMELGAIADVPMCEFWSKDLGFNTSFSTIQATSIAHVNGQSLVPAEAFTAEKNEGWKQHPGSMKDQGDWAFANGINQLVYHTFQHQALNEKLKPGMTMGPYGVHWDRGQTWWSMAEGYHRYISRCQFLLQQGQSVADILYLTPEGSPHIFRPPSSAMTTDEFMPDRKGYNFDGCSPGQLYLASVENNQIVFPGGATYKLLVLPAIRTMTPALLDKITSLIKAGATVVGPPPVKSPSLSGFPDTDQKVQSMARELWGSLNIPTEELAVSYGSGTIIWGGDLSNKMDNLYPEYNITARLLKKMAVAEDFQSTAPIRYTHRTSAKWDIYFVANRTNELVNADCIFRTQGTPELWDPLTGGRKKLSEFLTEDQQVRIPMQFNAHQSFFIVFNKVKAPNASRKTTKKNFPSTVKVAALNGPWQVFFDPVWGGPELASFNVLQDWSTREEDQIKYYSGIAMYNKTFDLPETGEKNKRLVLNLGDVKNMARVRLNGKDLGVLWTCPWTVDITDIVQKKGNKLEIEVANLWVNRLVGDEQLPDDGVQQGQWPKWLTNGEKRTTGRFTFTTFKHYSKESPLLPSGLLGPVTIQQAEQ